MDILDRREMKSYAAGRLSEQTFGARRLALFHAGILFLVLVAVNGINYYVNQQINMVAGLSGMGMLSVWETVQTVLMYAVNILHPFWQAGFVFAALSMARGIQTEPKALTEGFRRFGPLLRLMLLRGLLYSGFAFVCVYLSTAVYMATPMAEPLLELLLPIYQSGETAVQMQQMMQQLPMEQVTAAAMPVLVILIPVYVLVMLPVYYRFRLADLAVMDKPGTGALAALLISGALTRKRRMRLLRLDLSFWWYHGLQLLASLLCLGDMLLPYLGVSGKGIYIGCYLLGLIVQTVVFWYAGSYFHTTWAAAYDTLLRQPVQVPQPKAAPDPKKLPWDTYNSDN